MGKTITPKYKVYCYYNPGRWTIHIWRTKVHGRPNNCNAEKYRQVWNDSFKEGGTNYSASLQAGIILNFYKVEIRENLYSGNVIAESTMPMFEAI